MSKATPSQQGAAKRPPRAKGQQLVRITVYPRAEILDPQGKAIEAALERLEFKQVLDVRAGKSFEVTVRSKTPASAETLARRMCERLLANTNVETYSVEAVVDEDDS